MKNFTIVKNYDIMAEVLMITFDPLWRTLHTRSMNKGDLQKLTKLSSTTIAKLAKNEVVKLDVVDRICAALACQIQDVVEIKKS